jgi:hypothetical protein
MLVERPRSSMKECHEYCSVGNTCRASADCHSSSLVHSYDTVIHREVPCCSRVLDDYIHTGIENSDRRT